VSGDLAGVLRARRDAGHKLLIPYVMGGLADDWALVLPALARAGADAVEVGIPFSDPVMDGPVIQEAAHRSLQRGTTPHSVLDDLSRAEAGLPLAVMTYYNLVLRAGHRRLAHSLIRSGVTGAIVPDLPLEELNGWADEAEAAGVATVLLAAPSSPPERVAAIAERARGFVYAVARMGVTGERSALGDEAAGVVARVRECTDLPVCLGVGIGDPAQAAEAAERADGVVVGSALVRRLLDGGGPEGAGEFVGELRRALDRVAEAGPGGTLG
jgi:tryptophan synthase alpha chain